MQLVLLHRNEPDGDLGWSVLVGSGNLALTRMSLMFLQRVQNSYWLVNVSGVWVISQQMEVSGHDVFDQCVCGMVRQHQWDGRLSIGYN